MTLWLQILILVVYTVVLYTVAFTRGYKACYGEYEELIELFEGDDGEEEGKQQD